ncbi:MAG: TPM domain-containing protein [Aeromicrobium sp.]
MKAKRSFTLVRSVSAAIGLLLITLFGASGPASAEAPFRVTTQITDKAGVLGADEARVAAALKQFNRETSFQIYVIYVKSFDGLSGQAWVKKTAAKSTIGTTDIVIAISTGDGQYGVAEPREHAISDKEFSAVSQKYIRPAVNTGDWAGAAIDGAKGYQQASKDSGLPWAPIVAGISVILLLCLLLVHRSRQRYDETHEIRDEHGLPVDPLELLRTHELVDQAQLAVAGVDEPTLKGALAEQLSRLLRAEDSREERRALAIDIIHQSNETVDAPSASGARS